MKCTINNVLLGDKTVAIKLVQKGLVLEEGKYE